MVQATPFLLVWTAAFTLLSVVIPDTKKVSTYSIVLVFLAYFIDVLSNIWDEISFLGHFSPMNYFDPGLVMSKNIVRWGNSIFLTFLVCAIIFAGVYLFDRKDIL